MGHTQRWALDVAASRTAVSAFGGDTAAPALFRALGYAEEAVPMGKAPS